MVTEILFLTQLSDLSVEGAAYRSAMEGQPGETIMAHCVTTEQKTRHLVPLKREDVLTHTALQHLLTNTKRLNSRKLTVCVSVTAIETTLKSGGIFISQILHGKENYGEARRPISR